MESKVYDVCGRKDHLVKYIAKALECRLDRGLALTELSDSLQMEALAGNNPYLGQLHREEFSSHEFMAAYPDSIRGCRVFLVGSTDTSNNIMRMCVAIDAAKRNNAREIVAVIPYMGYSRQDKRDQRKGLHRSSVGAKVHAKLLEACGVDHVITVEMHAEQIELAFDSAGVDHVMMSKVIADAIKGVSALFKHTVKIAVGSPDMGGTKRQSRVMDYLRPQPLSNAKLMELTSDELDLYNSAQQLALLFSTVICSKHRDNNTLEQQVTSMDVIGDVNGKVVIFVDDMLDTGGTAVKAAEAVKSRGAIAVFYIITHPVMSGNAGEILQSGAIDQVITFDTLVMSERDSWANKKRIKSVPGYRTEKGTPPYPLQVLSIAPYLAEYMHAIITDTAVTR